MKIFQLKFQQKFIFSNLCRNQDGSFNCTSTKTCKLTFKTFAEAQEHRKTVKHFKCDYCEIEFWKFSELSQHQRSKECKIWTCVGCGENFYYKIENEEWKPQQAMPNLKRHRGNV